jgi:hypothetical protein
MESFDSLFLSLISNDHLYSRIGDWSEGDRRLEVVPGVLILSGISAEEAAASDSTSVHTRDVSDFHLLSLCAQHLLSITTYQSPSPSGLRNTQRSTFKMAENSMYHEMYRNARYAQPTHHYPTLC